MKTAFFFITVSICAYFCFADDKQYPSTWDNVDVDEVLGNERLFKQYYSCLTGEGKCTPDANALKKFLPDALKTKCGKCTDKQKEGAAKVIKFMTESKPEEWKKVVSIYDPTGEFTKAYEEDLKKITE